MTKTRLTKMIFDEVSLVASGDNPPALVVLSKAADAEDDDESGIVHKGLSFQFRHRRLTKGSGTYHRPGYTWVKPTPRKKGYWRKLPGAKGREQTRRENPGIPIVGGTKGEMAQQARKRTNAQLQAARLTAAIERGRSRSSQAPVKASNIAMVVPSGRPEGLRATKRNDSLTGKEVDAYLTRVRNSSLSDEKKAAKIHRFFKTLTYAQMIAVDKRQNRAVTKRPTKKAPARTAGTNRGPAKQPAVTGVPKTRIRLGRQTATVPTADVPMYQGAVNAFYEAERKTKRRR